MQDPLGAGGWLGHVLSDGVLFGAALFLAAVVGGVVARSVFSGVRFLAQGLFGEGVLLLVFAAAAHLRISALRLRGAVMGSGALLLIAVYWEAYHRCPYDLHVRRYQVDLTHGGPAAGTLRILHLSDFQTHHIGPFEERVVREAAGQPADLVVFTGDYVQPRMGSSRASAGTDFNALFRRAGIHPPLGFYAVEGDCERVGWQELFAGTGARCLEDEAVRVSLAGGHSLTLVGLRLDTSRSRDPEELLPVVRSGPPADIRIVIGHSPDWVDSLPDREPIQLVFAGHTHGGQVVFPFVGPLLTLSRLSPRYAGGLNSYHGIPLEVCRGTGMERDTAPQVRFMCPPEMCLLEIRY